MKVRIGNDIRLKVRINANVNLWRFGDAFPVQFNTGNTNIQFANVYFVNATLKAELEKEYKRKNRFIGRFPIEPFVDEFEPSAYNIHSTGYPKYKAFVFNEYKGFGVNPCWKNTFPIKEVDAVEYLACTERTSNPGEIIATFPAEAQLKVGKYDMIIVAKIFAPGYMNNVRTITLDYKNVFELVNSLSESDTDIPTDIDIDDPTTEPEVSDVTDVYVVSGQYRNNSINIKRNDNRTINIDVSPISGWYEV